MSYFYTCHYSYFYLLTKTLTLFTFGLWQLLILDLIRQHVSVSMEVVVYTNIGGKTFPLACLKNFIPCWGPDWHNFQGSQEIAQVMLTASLDSASLL